MTIQYRFISTDPQKKYDIVEVEVDDYFSEVIRDIEKKEFDRNRTETRRHNSYSDTNDKSSTLDSEIDIEETVIEQIMRSLEMEALNNAISALNESQQQLIRAIYFENISVSEYAAQQGVSQSAISQRLATAIKKLKKFLEKTL